MKISDRVKDELDSREIKLTYGNTSGACKGHNELSISDRKVATALHLTC